MPTAGKPRLAALTPQDPSGAIYRSRLSAPPGAQAPPGLGHPVRAREHSRQVARAPCLLTWFFDLAADGGRGNVPFRFREPPTSRDASGYVADCRHAAQSFGIGSQMLDRVPQ